MIRRRTFVAGLGSAPILLLPRRALAAYPDRPIHLIVPFAAGGNADIVGRITGDLISKALGRPVVVENRGGGGGSIGAEFVAHATRTATRFWSDQTGRSRSIHSSTPISAMIH